jgi:osmotically-inducible protein OsmY
VIIENLRIIRELRKMQGWIEMLKGKSNSKKLDEVKNRSAGAVVFIMIILMAGSGTAQDKTFDDADITNAVEDRLLMSQEVYSHLIDVETSTGVVKLSGSTSNLLSREKATELAETIKGVKSVVNTIEVIPVRRSDIQILDDIEKALSNNPAAESYEIDVTVSNGMVTLDGKVQSMQEKRLAEDIAKGVVGVRQVNNRIDIDIPELRRDDEIYQDIRSRLRSNPWVDEFFIDVIVDYGAVILSGQVGSAAEYRKAVYSAWVPGVRSVDSDNLEIRTWMNDEMKREKEFSAMTDEEIGEAVKYALIFDPRVASLNVDIDVTKGRVTLTGQVESLQARKAAENDARQTRGVWSVDNYLKVRPESIPDNGKLEAEVARALKLDPYVERFNLTIRAYDGLVYLEGDVNNTFEKNHAEDVASRVKGVIDIVNLIDSRYQWTWKSDDEIKQRVENRLYWSPFISENQVMVEVSEGVVTLQGTVATWMEKLNASEHAFEAGAKDVRNWLEVDLGIEYETSDRL